MADTSVRRLDDESDLDGFVDAHDVALVEFYVEGCPKCAAMEPVLGNVARAADVPVGLFNPRSGLSVLDRFDIDSTPTLVVFHDGDPVDRLAAGFVGAAEVIDFVRTAGT